MVSELEGYRWDAILLSETWRREQAEMWETHHKHISMGSGKFDNKHGVGIMLNKRWRQRIIDTEYINERAITTLGPGNGTERKSVGRYTLNEGNKRGDWLKSWLMLQDYTALNTMFRKTPQKQTTFISPKGNEKQIDYILTKRRHLKHIEDAEANDIIHMGSDHRCVMATFTVSMPGKNSNHKNMKGKHDTEKRERSTQAEKNISIEMPELEKYQEIVEIIKNTAATEETEAQEKRNDAKAQAERENAAAAKTNRTLEEADAQETGRRSMKSSSTETNRRGVSALHPALAAAAATAAVAARWQESDCRNNAST